MGGAEPLVVIQNVGLFAAMNALYLRAMTEGQAANAVWLQYTAPAWIYLASAAGFGERPDRRGARALLLAMAGVAVILAFNWEGEALRPRHAKLHFHTLGLAIQAVVHRPK